jgi:hypothetical protein
MGAAVDPAQNQVSTASSRLEVSMDLDLDELWDVNTAAAHARVKPATVRKWIERGHLVVAEPDAADGRRLRPLDVARAEHATRERARRTIATAA